MKKNLFSILILFSIIFPVFAEEELICTLVPTGFEIQAQGIGVKTINAISAHEKADFGAGFGADLQIPQKLLPENLKLPIGLSGHFDAEFPMVDNPAVKSWFIMTWDAGAWVDLPIIPWIIFRPNLSAGMYINIVNAPTRNVKGPYADLLLRFSAGFRFYPPISDPQKFGFEITPVWTTIFEKSYVANYASLRVGVIYKFHKRYYHMVEIEETEPLPPPLPVVLDEGGNEVPHEPIFQTVITGFKPSYNGPKKPYSELTIDDFTATAVYKTYKDGVLDSEETKEFTSSQLTLTKPEENAFGTVPVTISYQDENGSVQKIVAVECNVIPNSPSVTLVQKDSKEQTTISLVSANNTTDAIYYAPDFSYQKVKVVYEPENLTWYRDGEVNKEEHSEETEDGKLSGNYAINNKRPSENTYNCTVDYHAVVYSTSTVPFGSSSEVIETTGNFENVIAETPELTVKVIPVVAKNVEIQFNEDGTVSINVPTLAFKSNMAELTTAKSNETTIAKVYEILADPDYNAYKVIITGFVNPDGDEWTPEENELALARAKTICDKLSGMGIDSSRFEYKHGSGKTENKEFNRRVEFMLIN